MDLESQRVVWATPGGMGLRRPLTPALLESLAYGLRRSLTACGTVHSAFTAPSPSR